MLTWRKGSLRSVAEFKYEVQLNLNTVATKDINNVVTAWTPDVGAREKEICIRAHAP